MKDDAVYLHHILECIRRIEDNIKEGRKRFMASHTLQDAVIRNLQTMAEVAVPRALFRENLNRIRQMRFLKIPARPG